MKKKVLLYSILAILLGALLVALPSFLIRNSSSHPTTLSRSVSGVQEINKSRAEETSTSYFVKDLDALQRLFLIIFVPLSFAYLVFRFVKSKYGIFSNAS